jgi:glycosyltransferase involved in cell wall biosynthesis
MRIGIVFHKDPFAPPRGIDLVRLRAIAKGLILKGVQTEILSPVKDEGLIDGLIPVRNVRVLDDANRYDLVKTCYHHSVTLLGKYRGPVVSRIVRVVDGRLPDRDEAVRPELLRCQELIRDRATVLTLNNTQNQDRWRSLYGPEPRIVLVPTGCPREIPRLGNDPYDRGLPAILFLGSIAAPRMVGLLNETARRLRDVARVHLVGLNKTHLYGRAALAIDPSIVDHGEVSEEDTWAFVRHAAIGLALATGPHPFDNDVSKILNYLRGGLPVLSEEPIVNNELIRDTGFGRIFRYDDVADLVRNAREMIDSPPMENKERVMRFMAEEHSWDRRVETYAGLFAQILCASVPGPSREFP